MELGKVISLKYGQYVVLINNNYISCSKRGTLKKDNLIPKVGDDVLVNIEEKVIEKVNERRNDLKRPNISNIDQMFVIFSLREPIFSYHLAFKYFTYFNKFNIKSILVLTKVDKDIPQEEINEIKDVFNKLNIPTYVISSKTKEGLDELIPLFENKLSALSGQSGVGKSTLLNALDERFKRKEGEYSISLGRGKHETKETILMPYKGGFIADTPGFSSLDLELYKEDLAKYFPGFETYNDCYFADCLHISEKKCSIKDKLEKGEIPKIAYDSYLKLSNEAVSFIRRYL